MVNAQFNYPRGAEWRQWDFHIHTPASFEWKGQHFCEMTEIEKRASIDKMIDALNKAKPAVFVLMDYWTFDGWFLLKKRLTEEGAPKLEKKVFPGIELRLVSPTKYRLNAHVVFSDEISDQDLSDFQSKLEVALINQPLSNDCLIRLSRTKIGDDQLLVMGFNRTKVDSDDATALLAGSKVAEITPDSYQKAIKKVPENKAIGFMPWSTNDGLAKADWKKHYAYVISLMKSSPIFETRDPKLWAAFTGVKSDENKEWFDSFQAALDNIPRLAVSGSDAHSFADYGEFPSGKATWIKADPTYLGLLQAIKEPAKRSYLGDRPQKLGEVMDNKTFFINSIKVVKDAKSLIDGWLADCNLLLNSDLIAVIGNKGSGKSALADIIALLGNSRQKDHFSFLSRKRFRAKPKELARNFIGQMSWCDQTTSQGLNLGDDSESTSVELVKYIPQAHFEKLCNDHISGQSDIFENELRAVIFSHTSAAIRQKALDFNQLIELQESSYRDQLDEYRKDIRKLNREIESIETQLQPEMRQSLEELLKVKQRQIDEHMKIRPVSIPKPSEELLPEQKIASDELERIVISLKDIENKVLSSASIEANLASQIKAAQAVRERLRILQKQYKQFHDDTIADLKILGLEQSQVATLTTMDNELEQLIASIPMKQKSLVDAAVLNDKEKNRLLSEKAVFEEKLNKPQLLYQQNLNAIATWQEKFNELKGAADKPETLEAVKMRIEQLNKLPSLLNEKQSKRLVMVGDIFDILDAQRKAREELFKPVQDVIQNYNLIRDEYKLQFQANISVSADTLASALFALLKQNSGDFRGEKESFVTVKNIVEDSDLNQKSGVLNFVTKLYETILAVAKSNNKDTIGIASLLRVNKTSSDVYDLLFGLLSLEPRYSLLFQDTQIEQLSPGQRGALLLIFYLLVDKGRIPIVLDQPEENLDNETVVNLLVPVVTEAKKRRQIIMITHNPNLAVVCDAEQIIYANFDRKNASKIEYISGSIENPIINSHVVNVLEGTKPAFNNRRTKYH